MSAVSSAASVTPRRARTRASDVALWAALVFLAFVAFAALFPGALATHDPLQTEVRAAVDPPSAAHFFGTDQSGRDVFSRVIYGAGPSVGIGVLATTLALAAGLVLGSLSGVAPRIIDTFAMRVTDIVLAFPEFLVALVVVALLGPGHVNVAIAVTIAAVPVYIRLARTHTRTLRNAEHVEAARILGVGPAKTFLRHVTPAVLGSLSVLATIGIGSSILAAAGLSFLGLGPTEPSPEWGLMLSGGRNVLSTAWWVSVFPGLAISLTVIAATIVGRQLRSRLDGVRR